MATLLAPYNTAMQLGTGFNSFTQQICINDAVTTTKDGNEKQKPPPPTNGPVAQEVTYKTSIVDKVTDVTSEMNVNAAFSIKYDAFDAKGKVGFLNTSKVKESDVTFLISVKVVNQVIYDHSLLHFQPIDGIGSENFTEVYGDSFVSGYQEGGTFTAVISVKAKNEKKAREVRAKYVPRKSFQLPVDDETDRCRAQIAFTQNGETTEAAEGKEGKEDKNKREGSVGFDLSKVDTSFLNENETTISVTYTGGGQELKAREEDWTFETMRKAALQFPHLVAKTPMRTHAILTKYTALRSYHAHFNGLKMPAFEMAGVYSTILQEAYLDFKTVAKNLQVLAYDVSAGQSRLISASEARKKLEAASKPPPAAGADGATAPAGSEASTSSSDAVAPDTPTSEDSAPRNEEKTVMKAKKERSEGGPYNWKPIALTKDFPPSLQGLEDARTMVRNILIRIVQEINILSKYPEAALDEDRVQPHISPFLFKEFLPVGEPIKKESEDENDMDQIDRRVDMVKKSGGRF